MAALVVILAGTLILAALLAASQVGERRRRAYLRATANPNRYVHPEVVELEAMFAVPARPHRGDQP